MMDCFLQEIRTVEKATMYNALTGRNEHVGTGRELQWSERKAR